MPYKQRIESLTESHRLIAQVIEDKMKQPGYDELKVNALKKQKLIYKDELSRFIKAQEEHEAE